MNRCRTCKWWRGPNEKTVFLRGEEHTYRQASCMSPKMNDSADDAAGCDDGYGLIETGPDFGCIHHEPSSVPPSA